LVSILVLCLATLAGNISLKYLPTSIVQQDEDEEERQGNEAEYGRHAGGDDRDTAHNEVLDEFADGGTGVGYGLFDSGYGVGRHGRLNYAYPG
jgi:hypothetical protein